MTKTSKSKVILLYINIIKHSSQKNEFNQNITTVSPRQVHWREIVDRYERKEIVRRSATRLRRFLQYGALECD